MEYICECFIGSGEKTDWPPLEPFWDSKTFFFLWWSIPRDISIRRSVVKEPQVSDKMAQSGNILEKKWQQIVYEKHRRRVSRKLAFALLSNSVDNSPERFCFPLTKVFVDVRQFLVSGNIKLDHC